MKTLLVTGASGFLGQVVTKQPLAGWRLLRSARQSDFPLDLGDEDAIYPFLDRVRPNAILHLAAAANPNFCAENPGISYAINFRATQVLGTYAAHHQLPLLFTSTDLVFGGTQPPYGPEASPDPVNLYGEHKAAAEAWLLANCPTSCVARLPLLYGELQRPGHFLAAWHHQLLAGQPVGAFVDEWRTPAFAPDVAMGLFLLLTKGATGIWHLGGPERCSRWQMAQALVEKLGKAATLVVPQQQHQITMPAARPADVSLASEATYQLGYRPRPWSEGLRAAINGAFN